jgi:hypothetical protein
MYRLLAKQHKNYVTPISNGYPFIGSDGDWDIILIDECVSIKNAQISLENVLSRHFDADFDEDFNYYVNEELVYSAGDNDCIIDGIHLYVDEEREEDNDEDDWEELINPIDTDMAISIKEHDSGFDVRVDDKYLMCLSNLPIVDKRLIGRKVFWLDPTALRGQEHTSGYYILQEIIEDEDMLLISDDTEVYIDECYI